MKKNWRSVPAVPEGLLAAALQAQQEGVFIARRRSAGEAMEIVFANENFCAMTGYTAESIAGRGPGFLHADRSDVTKIIRWRRAAAVGKPLRGEGYLLRKDGATIHAAWSFSVIPAEKSASRRGKGRARPSITHFVATYRDITEKRRLQEALVHAQRLDAVGRLAGGVAHDFNNLLSVINGYCQLLAGQVVGQPQVLKEVEEIHQAGQKAAVLTRQLLAFGRRQPLKVRIVNLNRFISSNADILARLLGESGRLELQLDPNIGQVRIDPVQFQQVLFNLTLNARDAMQQRGWVAITTSRRKLKLGFNRRFTDAPPGDYVCVTIRDNGIGMTEEIQKQLFEPFFTTKPEGKGTGLGLSLVHGVIQQSGGFITVKSGPAEGSTFEILLPETQVREDSSHRRAVIEPLPSTRGHESVLLVEDDDVVRKMVTGILTADGYRVVAMKTPDEALRRARHSPLPPQLLITSFTAEADRLARTLHQFEPNLRVLSTTSRGSPESLGWLKRVRWIHLPKPYALSELLKAARALLDA
ncbi:MAG: sensor hybrid histidine kinase [Verrucomicrobia bacterium]|nr:sensor hybrid histidine kinase [Verrucomicrobiota bacterium]